jgi:hypothetical protein
MIHLRQVDPLVGASASIRACRAASGGAGAPKMPDPDGERPRSIPSPVAGNDVGLQPYSAGFDSFNDDATSLQLIAIRGLEAIVTSVIRSPPPRIYRYPYLERVRSLRAGSPGRRGRSSCPDRRTRGSAAQSGGGEATSGVCTRAAISPGPPADPGGAGPGRPGRRPGFG